MRLRWYSLLVRVSNRADDIPVTESYGYSDPALFLRNVGPKETAGVFGVSEDFDSWVQGDMYSLGMTAVTLATLAEPKQSRSHWPDEVKEKLLAANVAATLSDELADFINWLLRWTPQSKRSALSATRALSYLRELRTKSYVQDRVHTGSPSLGEAEVGCIDEGCEGTHAYGTHEVHRISNADEDGRDHSATDACSDALESVHYSDLELTSYPSRLLSSRSDVFQLTDGTTSADAKRFHEAQEKFSEGLRLLKLLQYRKAETKLSQALDKFQALDERGVLAQPSPKIAIRHTEGYIGICLLHLGRSRNAQDYVKIGVELREYLHEDDDRLAAWMLHYADVLMEQDQFVKASTYIDKALRLCDQTGSSSAVCGIRAAGMAKQALVLLLTGDLDHAELFAARTEKLSARLGMLLGRTGLFDGDDAEQSGLADGATEESTIYAQYAPATESHRLVFHADALVLLGLVYQRKPNIESFEKARKKYVEALEYLKKAKRNAPAKHTWAIECLTHYRLGTSRTFAPICRMVAAWPV